MASRGRMLAVRPWYYIVASCLLFTEGDSKLNQIYYMEGERCSTELLLGGATVYSHYRLSHHPSSLYNHNSECQIVFRAKREGWKLMLTFDYLDIPDRSSNELCIDAVYIYDSNTVGSRAVKTAGGNAGLCGNNAPSMIVSSGKYLTVYFRSDSSGSQGRGFKFTITAFSEDYLAQGSCSVDAFRCRNGKCVDGDLTCDGVSHCSDGSDEDSISYGPCGLQSSVATAKPSTGSSDIWDEFLALGVAACVGIVGGTIVIVVLLVVCVVCTCRKCLIKETEAQPRQSLAGSVHAGLLSPPTQNAGMTAYKQAPWAGMGPPPPGHGAYTQQGYFPLTAQAHPFLPPPQILPQQQGQPHPTETVFSPHVHRDTRDSYSLGSGYGPNRPVAVSGAFAQPMHTRPTGHSGPRSYTPTTTSSRSGSSSAAYGGSRGAGGSVPAPL